MRSACFLILGFLAACFPVSYADTGVSNPATVLTDGGLRPANTPLAIPVMGEIFSCKVEGVHDGDGPIYCDSGLKIRLTAIAARELDGTCTEGHPCPASSAEAATLALTRLVEGQTLTCEATGTTYGRVAAWCWREDGREVNCEMVRSGTALHWVRFDPEMHICGGDTVTSE